MAANRRIYFAIQACGFAPFGSTSYVAVHGLQSLGMNTKFNLEQVFEIGQLNLYQTCEGLPDIEMTLEKVLDGYPLIYHMATQGAPTGDLVGRSNQRANVAISIFGDLQSAASGAPIQMVTCSGMYLSSVAYDIKVEGNATESVTMVGNNKLWATSPGTGGTVFTGGFTNNDAPLAAEGVNRRQNLVMASSVFPLCIPGITAVTGVNALGSDGNYNVKFQSVHIAANFGREALMELGHKAAYFRYVNFPVQVQCDLEILDLVGDSVNALENGTGIDGNNLDGGDHIYIQMTEGTKIDLGTLNELSSVNYGGANAGSRGGNAHSTYSFISFNSLLISHPQDPTTALRA